MGEKVFDDFVSGRRELREAIFRRIAATEGEIVLIHRPP